ncbi:MAG: hypothetical protein EPN97_07010 [Alphaproteobacteria bacterium]|nr:MAG: hypothetical protein EPN97_07010 [Alphaproteobacteria bacterium]
MKRILLFALFAMLLTGLSATASLAACRPGCDCPPNGGANDQGSHNYADTGFFGMQEARAQSIIVRDRSTARQIHHQNDNGPGMTCFDHAMGLTSRLGQLFSDIVPQGIPAASTRAFGTVAYQAYGSDQWLSKALDVVIYPTLSEHANDFQPDSLSFILGATAFPFWGGFMGAINGFISSIMGVVNQITSYVNTLNTLWSYFQQIVNALNGQIPTWIIALVPTITAFWNSVVLPMINATIGALLSAVNGIMQTITNTIMGVLGSMTNFMNPAGPAPQDECARIQNLWGVGGGFPAVFQTGLMRALTGTGIQTGNSYFSYANLLTMAPAGVGQDFLNELNLPTPALNQGMMNRALSNLTGPLSGPGAGVLRSWTVPPAGMTNLPNAAPAYSPGANTTLILNAM